MPRDPRLYITVHNGMPDHPKIEGLSDGAFRLLVTAWCWCSRNLTDGFIKATSWDMRGTAKARRELIAAGLVETVDGGVRMHDYTEHQRTAEEVQDLRSKRADAGRKGGLAKQANRVASATAVAKQTGSKHVADTDTDKEELEGSSSRGPRKRGTRLPEGWIPSEDVRRQMGAEFPHVDLRAEHEKFCDYWHARAGREAVKVDWDATWRNWIRNSSDRQPRQQKHLQAVPSYETPPAPAPEELPWGGPA